MDVRIYDVEPPTHCMVHGLERKKENKKDIDWKLTRNHADGKLFMILFNN